jgi:hypothetical protein
MVGMLMLSNFKNAGAIPTMAGMLMLSGVGKMNFKKAVLVGALCGYEKQGAYVYQHPLFLPNRALIMVLSGLFPSRRVEPWRLG